MLESQIFCQISAKLLLKTESSTIVETKFGMEFSKRLFSTFSEHDFNQNVREVAYSIYIPVYWPIAQNVGTWLGNKAEIYIYLDFL